MNKEMLRALQADGEKLRQLTGEDHGPWELPEPPAQWFVCDACDGSGEIVRGEWGYEAGCTHGHMMEIGEPCSTCEGHGGWIGEIEGD